MIRFKETTILFYRQLGTQRLPCLRRNDSLAVDGSPHGCVNKATSGVPSLLTALTGNTDYRAHYTFWRNLPDAVIFRNPRYKGSLLHPTPTGADCGTAHRANRRPGRPAYRHIFNPSRVGSVMSSNISTMQVGQRHVEFLRILTSKRHIAVGRPQRSLLPVSTTQALPVSASIFRKNYWRPSFCNRSSHPIHSRQTNVYTLCSLCRHPLPSAAI